MLQSITPVSFKQNINYQYAGKFVGNEGKKLNLLIKATSEAKNTYKLDAFIHDADGYIQNGGYYSSGAGKDVVQSSAEYMKEIFKDIMKLGKLLEMNNVKDSEMIMDGLIDFASKAGK